MAVNNTAKTYANMEFPLAMKRQDAFALDPSTVWPTLADAFRRRERHGYSVCDPECRWRPRPAGRCRRDHCFGRRSKRNAH